MQPTFDGRVLDDDESSRSGASLCIVVRVLRVVHLRCDRVKEIVCNALDRVGADFNSLGSECVQHNVSECLSCIEIDLPAARHAIEYAPEVRHVRSSDDVRVSE